MTDTYNNIHAVNKGLPLPPSQLHEHYLEIRKRMEQHNEPFGRALMMYSGDAGDMRGGHGFTSEQQSQLLAYVPPNIIRAAHMGEALKAVADALELTNVIDRFSGEGDMRGLLSDARISLRDVGRELLRIRAKDMSNQESSE